MKGAKRWTVEMGLNSAGFEGFAQEVNRVEWKWAKKVLHGHQGGKAEERGGIRATIDGSAWTEDRLWKAGYRESPICTCGHENGNTPHRIIRCPLHDEGRKGVKESVLRAAEAFLGEGAMSLRVQRLIPMMRLPIPAGPKEEDTLVQEVRWNENHGTGYQDKATWAEEDAITEAGLKIGDRDLKELVGISDEVKKECRRWKAHRQREGAIPDDALED